MASPLPSTIGSPLSAVDPSLAVPTAEREAKRTALGQEQFMALMLQQFRNQDPLKPQDPGQFLAQLAQFSSVAGIADINRGIGNLAEAIYSSQALQASGMVGRNVLTEGNTARLADGGSVQGGVELPAATRSGFVRIYDGAGVLVRELPLGDREQGLATFTWDGTTRDGTAVQAGTYRVIGGYRDGAQEVQATTYVSARVAGVNLDANGSPPALTMESGRRISLRDVRAIL
jgi:flagellar basal-body rod modification protein FlgD